MTSSAQNSSTTTSSTTPAKYLNAESNADFMKKWKKARGATIQTKLPTPVTAQNEWAIKSGFSIADAQMWRNLCDKAKYGYDDASGLETLQLLVDTIDMATQCDGHPIGLMNYGRSAFAQQRWTPASIEMLRANMLPSISEDGEEGQREEGEESPEGTQYENGSPRGYHPDDPTPVHADADEEEYDGTSKQKAGTSALKRLFEE